MADATVVSVDPPTEPPPEISDFDSGLDIPSLGATFFSHHLFLNGDSTAGEYQNDDMVVLEDLDLDLDFSFDDIGIPSSHPHDNLHNQLQQSNCQTGADSNFTQFSSNSCHLDVYCIQISSCRVASPPRRRRFFRDHSWDGPGLMNSASPDTASHHISGYLNTQSTESNVSNGGSTGISGSDGRRLNCHSPKSQVSGNFESNVSENSNNCAARSVSSSPNSTNKSVRNGVVDQKIKLEERTSNKSNISY